MLEQTRGENICYRHLATSDDNEIWRTHTLEKRYDNRKNTNKSHIFGALMLNSVGGEVNHTLTLFCKRQIHRQ
jgi:hypothetical protein